MGNIRPTFIKLRAIILCEEHGEKFTDDFDHNKKMVEQLTDVESKEVAKLDCWVCNTLPPAQNRLRSQYGD